MLFNLPSFEKARILTVGDVMLDRYWHGEASRISPEAPVPVVKIDKINERPGGAGNVALNVRALAAEVFLLGMIGQDHHGDVLNQKLQAAGVNCQWLYQKGLPTTTKLRVISRQQQLIRLDFEEIEINLNQEQLLAHYQALLPDIDVVILSDYGKGLLHQPQSLIKLARQMGKPILIDPKSKDFRIYQGATLLTPNLKEFEAVVGHCHDENALVSRGLQLIAEYDLSALLITRGADGMTLLQPGLAEQHFPAHAREVFDVTGAGDTVIAVLATSLASGADLAFATSLANRAASITVAKLGAATVSVPELRRALSRDSSLGTGVLNEAQLKLAREDARAHHEKVVMTNGCFDILHAGHIAYLEQAKALGNRLIVAVNDDDSVRRLKGENRPINSLERRMAVLAGLGAVDWVVSFSEDTPQRLISEILPDVLVKGGDYQVDQIAGSREVLAHGGTVKILTYVDGCSTTQIVNQIQQIK